MNKRTVSAQLERLELPRYRGQPPDFPQDAGQSENCPVLGMQSQILCWINMYWKDTGISFIPTPDGFPQGFLMQWCSYTLQKWDVEIPTGFPDAVM